MKSPYTSLSKNELSAIIEYHELSAIIIEYLENEVLSDEQIDDLHEQIYDITGIE